MTAAELLEAYAVRSRSPVEVLAEAARRIEADVTGAFWTTCLERAADEARRAEEAWGRGEARPLEGVPFAAKDIFDTAGVRTTYGSAMFADHVPARDADAVARMRAAGAILLGKTATHEFAWGFTTINDGVGTCRNPHDLERVPGGSSGGSGAALAAGLVPLALGTDTGGSIRVPCAFCRVAGLKPTWGRVSLAGVWPLARSLDHAGPMARTVADVELMYRVLSVDSVDLWPTESTLERVTVGLCPDLHGAPLEPGPLAAYEGAAAALGATVTEVAFPEAELIVPAFRAIQLAEALQVHTRAGLYPGRRDEYGPDVGSRLDMATAVTADDLLDAAAARETVRAAFARLFGSVDVLLTPVSPIPPPRIQDERTHPVLRDAVVPYTVPQDLVGLPAATLPAGMQLTGPPGAEARVLRAAAALA